MTGTMSQVPLEPANNSSIRNSSAVAAVILAGLTTGATVVAVACNSAEDGAAWATSRCNSSSHRLSMPRPRGATAGVGEPVAARAAIATTTTVGTVPRVVTITTRVA